MGGQTSSATVPPEVAELILQDEALTSGLEDPAAGLLLRWAIGLAGQAVRNRAQAGQALDRSAVADVVAPVRRLARQVNDLVAARAGLDEREFLARLLNVIDRTCQLVAHQ